MTDGNACIADEQSLLDCIGRADRVIVGGGKAQVVIALRQIKKQGDWEKLQGISVIGLHRHNCYETENIRPEYLLPDQDTVLLLAYSPIKQQIKTDFLTRLHPGWQEEQIFYLDHDFLAGLSRRDHPKMDFCCVGFPKCGTTSLYYAFRKNSRIYMSATKETQYFRWKSNYLDGPERFLELYMQDIPEGKVVGAIEPTYHRAAAFTYETFGPDVKLIFMLRSPASAAFSYYKMMLRRTGFPETLAYYKKYHKPCPEMFQEYMQDVIFSGKEQRFLYDKWIEEYLHFFSREQMMFVIFEEMIQDPARILKEMQKFIGVKPKKYQELPHTNSGDMVSKNYLCARINKKLLRMKMNRQVDMDGAGKDRFYKFRDFCEKFTLTEFEGKLSDEDRKELNQYYQASTHHLEEIIGRKLEGIWY